MPLTLELCGIKFLHVHGVYMQFKKLHSYKKKNQKVLKKIIIFIIILLLSVCRLLVTEFLEQMKKTDHKEDIPRGYVLEDLEDHDKNIHYERS